MSKMTNCTQRDAHKQPARNKAMQRHQPILSYSAPTYNAYPAQAPRPNM